MTLLITGVKFSCLKLETCFPFDVEKKTITVLVLIKAELPLCAM